jgi:Zn finger protein HypA/HybF involved in hydrogenase expression
VRDLIEFAFQKHDGLFRCQDCHEQITLIQYRRKVPRCDECEVMVAMAKLEEFEARMVRSPGR